MGLLAIYPALIFSALSGLWLMMHRRMILSGGLILASAVLLGLGMTWLGQPPMGDEFAAWFFD